MVETFAVRIGDVLLRGYEVIDDGTFEELFSQAGKLPDLTVSEEETERLFREHVEVLSGYKTYFLLEKEGKLVVRRFLVNRRGVLKKRTYSLRQGLLWSFLSRRQFVGRSRTP
jgi:hypothetical protein